MPRTSNVAAHPKRTERSKYEILFEQATDAIVTVSRNGSIDDVNRAFEALTGYVRSEVTDGPIDCLIPSADKLASHGRVRPLSIEYLSQSGTYEDVAIVRKDGFVTLVDLSVRVIDGVDGSTDLTFVLLRDVTEKKKMERELITKHTELKNAFLALEKANAEIKSSQALLVQSGKMAALGELTAGISHELNQPLQAIRGYAQETQAIIRECHFDDKATVESYLNEAITAVDKMSQIIDFLRAFVRKSGESFEMTSVHQAIDDSIKMLGRQLASRGIEVVRNYDEQLPLVYANPIQLEQVFINLTSNARDAIDETKRGRGTITITTRTKDKYIEILFKDDGVGMNERTISKAFNPFFTTKEVGKGMGMGLSLSYGMISKVNGTITIESELGKGTTFIVKIPIDFRNF